MIVIIIIIIIDIIMIIIVIIDIMISIIIMSVIIIVVIRIKPNLCKTSLLQQQAACFVQDLIISAAGAHVTMGFCFKTYTRMQIVTWACSTLRRFCFKNPHDNANRNVEEVLLII